MKKILKILVAEGVSKEDSTFIVNGFINRWATQLLLVDGAERNLPEEKQENFEKLVDQYKKDLYTKAYLEALVKKSIDTSVSDEEAQQVYEANKETFKLNEELVSLGILRFLIMRLMKMILKNDLNGLMMKTRSIWILFRFNLNPIRLMIPLWIQTSQIVKKFQQ